jgi:hypothetical protein
MKITYRNPLDCSDTIEVFFKLHNIQLTKDWAEALKELLISKNILEKNYCFMGFPKTARTLDYLCNELNQAVMQINKYNATGKWQSAGLDDYVIEEWFTPDSVRFGEEYEIGYTKTKLGLSIKHEIMNKLHNHFERLQGTVWGLSDYYKRADYETKFAIRQLNNLCHEIENLILSQRKQATTPEWVRPSQITTFLQSPRYNLTDEHRQGFSTNGYDRKFGTVYMHWTQIGKTLYEVFRDENAPDLTIGEDPTDITIGAGSTCEAITALKYYSGEFDIEWAQDVVYKGGHPWHDAEIEKYYTWLDKHNLNKLDTRLSLGYLPIAEVDFELSFGTNDVFKIWDIMSQHLDIFKIEIDGVTGTFDYCWSDDDYKQMQIDMMKPGYDYSSRR